MSAALTIIEKHEGAFGERANLRTWLRMLSCTMTIEKLIQRRLANEFGSTLPRFDVLAALDRCAEGMSMGELSRALLVSNGNVTAIVQALKRDKHVVTSPHPSDRRSAVVRLTDHGKRHFTAMAAAHHQWIEDLFSSLSTADRDGLFEALGHLKSSLGEATHGGQS